MSELRIGFQVNGEELLIPVTQGGSLLDLLRDRLGLDEAPPSCGDGQCGACLVLVDGSPVRACRLPADEVAGREVLTAEGLSESAMGRALLDRFSASNEEHELGCGRCVPGLLLAALSCLENAPEPPDLETARAAMRGHPCACLYQDEIAAAAVEVAREGAV
ncbi:MAG: 2Fe-2S iron-sulfur cluster-binding protein [Planctomycetota bacterium]